MALLPKRVKHRKVQRGTIRGDACRGNQVSFGQYGLQSLDAGFVTGRQIEACRVAINREIGAAGGKYWIRIFPHKPMTSKPLETRMGKGKGEPEFWVACIRPGTVMFEVGGVPKALAKLAMSKAGGKLPVRCRLAERRAKIGN